MRLVEAVHARLTDAHLNMVLRPRPTPLMEGELYLNTSYGQLVFQPPGEEELYAHAAGVLTILAPESLTHLARIDPRIISDADRARAPVARILERRRRAGSLGWTTCVSYIDPANRRSIALAERLGAQEDTTAPKPDAYCRVYRHPGPVA